MSKSRPKFEFLKAFLCHASEDKPAVRAIHAQLTADGICAWLDKETLLPGQVWDHEIREAVRSCNVFLVCLSAISIKKDGYVQKEMQWGLDLAATQPDKTVAIPIRLEQCEIPETLQRYERADIFWKWDTLTELEGYKKLMRTMRSRAKKIGAPLLFEEDKKLVGEISNLFRRPAFRGPFLWQTDPRPAARVIALTLKAMNTGRVEDSEGSEWKGIQPIAQIRDDILRSAMTEVTGNLKTAGNLITRLGQPETATDSKEILREIDSQRDVMIATLNRVLERFEFDQLPLPTEARDSTDVYERFPSR